MSTLWSSRSIKKTLKKSWRFCTSWKEISLWAMRFSSNMEKQPYHTQTGSSHGEKISMSTMSLQLAHRSSVVKHQKSMHAKIRYLCDKFDYQACQMDSLKKHEQSFHAWQVGPQIHLEAKGYGNKTIFC